MEPQAQQEALVVPSGEAKPLVVLGDHQTVKISGAQTNGAFAVIEQNNPAGVGVPPYYHTKEDEIFYVVDGEIEFTVDGKKIIGKPGMTVYLPRRVRHSFQCVGAGMNKALITVVPAGNEVMFQELSELPPGPPDIAKITAICAKYGVVLG